MNNFVWDFNFRSQHFEQGKAIHLSTEISCRFVCAHPTGLRSSNYSGCYLLFVALRDPNIISRGKIFQTETNGTAWGWWSRDSRKHEASDRGNIVNRLSDILVLFRAQTSSNYLHQKKFMPSHDLQASLCVSRHTQALRDVSDNLCLIESQAQWNDFRE